MTACIILHNILVIDRLMEEIGVRYDPSRVLEEVELPVVDVQAGAGDAVKMVLPT